MKEGSNSRYKTNCISQKKIKLYFSETEGRVVKKLKQENEFRQK